MTDAGQRRAWIAAPDGLPAAVMLAFLGTAGMFYVNLMPAIVSGLRDALGYSNQQAGYVAAANVYGAALGALVALLLVRRTPWKRVQVLALAALAALDFASIGVTRPGPLIVLRALHGVCGGLSIGVGLAIMARTRVPQRAFGAQFTLQVVLGGLGLMWLPELAARAGAYVLFLTLAAIALVTLALLPFLDAYPPRPAARAGGGGGAGRAALLAATLLAVFLFQAANMALFAFIVPLGRHFGLELPLIDTALGLANWISAAGSLFAIWAGGRYGRSRPLLAALLVAVVGTLGFRFSQTPALFFACNVVTGIAWSFVIPNLFAMCAGFDPSGSSATLGGLCSKLGLATGPLIAPILIGADGYPRLIALAAAALAGVAVAGLWPARVLDREPRAG